MENLTGKQFGAYRIVAPLGEGGMAAVYKAFQPGIDRYVAIKVLPRHLANDPQFIGRFEQEAKVLAKLQHPHILPIHDYGEAEGFTYIVMPLIDGGDLTDLLQRKQFTPAEIEQVISQVGDALDYAHSLGVVHRDIKPSNILVDHRGNCLLTDFGIAKLVEGAASDKLTATGHVVGTPSYMSPEQGYGKPLDSRSDIYSLGVILYEMATGRVPFRAETPMAVVIKHMNAPLPPPREFNPNLPNGLERVILKAMAKNPNDRYPTAGEMVTALRHTLQQGSQAPVAAAIPNDPGLTSLSQTGPVAQPAAQTVKLSASTRNRISLWLVVGVPLVIILLLAILLGLWFLSRPGPIPAAPPPPPPPAQPAQEQPALQLPPPPTPSRQPQATATRVVPEQSPTLEQQQPPPEPQQTPLQQQQPPPQPQQPSRQQPPPPPGDGPPPEAIQACAGQSQGAACRFTAPHGPVTGSCMLIRQQLACVPPGGPPPQP